MSTAQSFSSALGPKIASFLDIKKALGRRFAEETRVLAHLDRFLVARSARSAVLSPETFSAWSLGLEHLTPTVRRNRMRIVRNLCLYLRRTDPDCFVPDPSTFPSPHTPRRPHIFTEEEVARLLRVAAGLPRWTTSPLRAEVYRLAIVLLYTAGLRLGELVRLVLSDYDAAERTLLVRTSKFHKSRLVALSKDATREMQMYLRARRRLPHHADAPLLVSRHGGLRAYSGNLGQGLRSLFHCANLHSADGRLPHVHDLRHTHAVHALLRWYRAGVDVQAKLPALSTSMGHVSIASTAYYLALLDPVAQAASTRFAQHCGPILDALPADGGDR
jgi:integrase/recombinase XerD